MKRQMSVGSRVAGRCSPHPFAPFDGLRSQRRDQATPFGRFRMITEEGGRRVDQSLLFYNLRRQSVSDLGSLLFQGIQQSREHRKAVLKWNV
jgi:hypothetical protein